jgi:outer membrane biosynthesis protein TonB
MSPSRNLNANSGLRAGFPVDDRGERSAGFLASALLHACIFLGALITLEHAKLDIADQAPPMVPVDLVTIADKTNIAPTVQEEPKLTQDQITPEKQDIVPPTLPAIQEPAEPAPSEQATPVPALAQPKPALVPKAKPKEIAEKKSKKAVDETLDALVNNIMSKSAAPKNAKVASRTQRGFGDLNAMTMDLGDSLRNQIEQCMNWGAIAGSPNARNIVVSVDLTLNHDGSVAQRPQLESQSASDAARDPYVRAAADAALRAIHVCAPYKLPADRYADWRDSQVNFSPRDIIGQ